MTRDDQAYARPGSQGQFIALAVAALMCVGLAAAASTNASLNRSIFPTAWWGAPFGRQGVFVALGFAAMLVTGRLIGPRVLGSPRLTAWGVWILLAVAVSCLILVLFVADSTRGSQRWLRTTLGGWDLGFQPSELAKPVLVAWLALWLTQRRQPESKDRLYNRRAKIIFALPRFLPAAGVVGVCVALVGVVDFSTAALLAAVGGAMLFVGGGRLAHLGVAAAVGAGGFAVLLLSKPYRLERLLAFRDIWADPRGLGYHPIQSLTTIASGGWFGQGLGASVQKYGYLPESRTDFIFSVLCEETGLVGGFLVIGLFIVFVWAGLRTMWIARSGFERLLAFGITAIIGLQATMNIAVVTVCAPTTGIPLPFISAGGSGVVVLGTACGMLIAVASRTGESPVPPENHPGIEAVDNRARSLDRAAGAEA